MQAQPLNADQIEQLVAPIALYPDALLAQVLAASTYPAQVAAADQWLRAQGNASPEQIASGADAQTNWDPSIKARTAFPQVLAQMDRNLQWTTNLGANWTKTGGTPVTTGGTVYLTLPAPTHTTFYRLTQP